MSGSKTARHPAVQRRNGGAEMALPRGSRLSTAEMCYLRQDAAADSFPIYGQPICQNTTKKSRPKYNQKKSVKIRPKKSVKIRPKKLVNIRPKKFDKKNEKKNQAKIRTKKVGQNTTNLFCCLLIFIFFQFNNLILVQHQKCLQFF